MTELASKKWAKALIELVQEDENLSKEEANYNKDQLEMNHSLLRWKKKLAKTKLEENIFFQYGNT